MFVGEENSRDNLNKREENVLNLTKFANAPDRWSLCDAKLVN